MIKCKDCFFFEAITDYTAKQMLPWPDAEKMTILTKSWGWCNNICLGDYTHEEMPKDYLRLAVTAISDVPVRKNINTWTLVHREFGCIKGIPKKKETRKKIEGYQPNKGKLDSMNPPRGGSGVPQKEGK